MLQITQCLTETLHKLHNYVQVNSDSAIDTTTIQQATVEVEHSGMRFEWACVTYFALGTVFNPYQNLLIQIPPSLFVF